MPQPGSFVPKLVEAKIKLPGEEPRALTDLEIVAQAYTMILAGYSFTSSSEFKTYEILALACCLTL